MASSNFMRLYRELGLSEPSKKPHDLSYFKERMEILQQLNPNNPNNSNSSNPRNTNHIHNSSSTSSKALPTVVRRLKHHGKLARLRRGRGQRPVSAAEIESERNRGNLAAVLAKSATATSDDPHFDVLGGMREKRMRRQREEEERIKRDREEETYQYEELQHQLQQNVMNKEEAPFGEHEAATQQRKTILLAEVGTLRKDSVITTAPLVAPLPRKPMSKLESRLFINHIQYKYEQTKRIIHEELEPYVKSHMDSIVESMNHPDHIHGDASVQMNNKKQKIPKNLISKLASHEHRLSTTNEKYENNALTLEQLGMKSALRQVNDVIKPSERHLPVLNTTNISLSPQSRFPNANLIEDAESEHAMHSEGESLSLQEKGSMGSTLKSRLYAITNQRSPPKAPKYIPTVIHDTKFHEKSYSGNPNPHSRWSHEELERFRALFHELPLPSTFATSNRQFNPITKNQIINANQVELWKMYMINFADRFCTFHPHRSVAEVTEKLQHMISKKQFKFHGEEEYWRQLQYEGCEIIPKSPRNQMDFRAMEKELDLMS